MGSQMLLEIPYPILPLIFTEKWVNVICFIKKLRGSGTHCSKIDGFPGTHGTHANGATGELGN